MRMSLLTVGGADRILDYLGGQIEALPTPPNPVIMKLYKSFIRS